MGAPLTGGGEVLTQFLSVWPLFLVIGVFAVVLMPRVGARRLWRKRVSEWVPPELRPRRERAEAVQELAAFRAASGYDGPESPLARA